MTRPSGAELFDYANGAGGRIFDLPRLYQDRVAEAVRRLHPGSITVQVQKVMASDGYLRSDHPLLRQGGKAVTDGAG